MTGSNTLLQIEELEVYYGPIQALAGVSMEVRQGEIVSLLGANGAGKTTMLHAISGLITPSKGQIAFGNMTIAGLSPEAIVKLGIGQVPEHRQVFGTLSVRDNLELGAYHHYRRSGKKVIHQKILDMFELFPILGERQTQLAGTLSGGQQQMLAIARALMTEPKLLLLDEPSLGLAPIIVKEVLAFIEGLRRETGMTILLIEQNVFASLQISDRAYVIQRGNIVKQGASQELLEDDEVKEAYLGHKAV